MFRWPLSCGVLVWLLAVRGALAAAPSDNPVATWYSEADGYPAWTDRIRWDRTIDMSTYAKGRTPFEKFEAARDELAEQGGGVLYYPAGVYDFSERPGDGPTGRGLMLKKGVVIRGEPPKVPFVATKQPEQRPATRFLFGFRRRAGGEMPRDWNLVGLAPGKGQRISDVHDVGICDVELVGGVIYFGPDVTWGPTWKEAGSFLSARVKPAWGDRRPDGTHPGDPFAGGTPEKEGGKCEGLGEGRLVFRCRLEDSVFVDDYCDFGAGPDSFHMARFCGRITVYGSRTFVAGNVVPRSRKNFVHPQNVSRSRSGTGVDPVLFDYANAPGLDVNKTLYGLVRNDGEAHAYDAEGVVVRDNVVFSHGGKGFNVCGKWLTIRDNRNEREYLRSGDDVYGLGGDWTLTLNGYNVAGGASDNLSRAFDVAGRNVWVDGNTFDNCGSDPGNDGEGILCQLHGGTHVHSWAVTRNRYDRRGGEPSYIGGWDVHCRGFLIAFNDIPSGWVGNAVIRKGTRMADCAFVGNACTHINPDPQRSKRPEVLEGTTLPLVVPPKERPQPPKNVAATRRGSDAVRIVWTDATDHEIGYRIERRLDDGPWHVVAWRPPQIQKDPGNPPEWVDFTAPPNRDLVYRVIASGIDEKEDSGASPPTSAIRLERVRDRVTAS